MPQSAPTPTDRQSLLSPGFDPYLSLNYMLNDVRTEKEVRSVRRLGLVLSVAAALASAAIAVFVWLYLPLAVALPAQLSVSPAPLVMTAPIDVVVTHVSHGRMTELRSGDPIMRMIPAADFGLSGVDGGSTHNPQTLAAPRAGSLRAVARQNQGVPAGDVLAILIQADAMPVITTRLTRRQVERVADDSAGSIATILQGGLVVLPTRVVAKTPVPGSSTYDVQLAVPPRIAAAFADGTLSLGDLVRAKLILRNGMRDWFAF